MLAYSALNDMVLKNVPVSAIKILDVGCGTGMMGKALKEQYRNRIIYGITYSNKEAAIAEEFLDKVFVVDINNSVPGTNIKFDCILFSHVLEHTYYPELVLGNYLKLLSEEGIVVIALPNILYYKQRFQFLKGAFKYSPNGGLMDVTHFRFFDWQTAQEMIKNSGLKIVSKEVSGNFPLPLIRKTVPPLGKFADRVSLKFWPGLFAFQFVFVAKR
ncbi:MAG TPA: class I SAM-dependent methyltransferase [Chitinophagaceae bacterium]|nr:class I SAM-dependent methyltransferase [Chitinophagaceae bacterium]